MKGSIIKNNKRNLYKLFILFFWISIWQGVHWIIGRDIYVPSPFHVFSTLKELMGQWFFWKTIGFSIYRVILGLSLSILTGIVLGIFSSLNPIVYDLLHPLVVAIKSTPVLSFIILALIWFSSSNVPIFICFLMCFPIIWTNVVTGIRNVDKKLLEMARVYGVKKWLILKKIYLPSIMPYISSACITALGLGWKVSVAAEVLSHPRNAIGSYLYSAKVYLESKELFAWTLVVILLSLLFEKLIGAFIERLSRKRTFRDNGIQKGDYENETSN
ncbi:MAG: ABC transporter permease [Thermotaleaceae bacterium]